MHLKSLIIITFLIFTLLGAFNDLSANPEIHPITDLPVHLSDSTITAHNLVDFSPVKINLKDGQTKVIVFLSAKCPCSSSHEQLLSQMAQEFNQLKFFGIHSNVDEAENESKEHFLKANFPFPVIQDSKAVIANKFQALKTPHVFILNGKGDTIYSGGITDSHDVTRSKKNYLMDALNSVKKGENPNPSVVRTLGCFITRS